MATQKAEKFMPVIKPLSTKPPTPMAILIDGKLKAYMDENMKLETSSEMDRRDHVLRKVEKIFKNWVVEMGTTVMRMSEEEAKAAGGELFVSGSHKLGVREPGADIDTICVAPNFCTREHFFSSLKETLLNHPDVTELSAVESARVPIMSFDFEKVSIDLLFARLGDDVVPNKLDILDDRILSGLDDATVTTLNGPRVTLMIPELVGKEAYPNFLIVLRCVRKWAKVRGLYGNKHGYLGGINCNLLVVFICQLFPNASPSTLLARFFQVYGGWKWSHMNPVQVNKIQPNPPNLYGEQRDVWSSENNPEHVMPIITPAYPAMNSSANVSVHTRDIMQQEMQRAHEIIKTILEERGKEWGRLFESSDFYLRYPHYLCCHIIGDGDNEDSRSWIGYVESRIGRLPQVLERLPLKHPIHFYPCYSKTQKSANSICYFIGFNIDHNHRLLQRGDKEVHIDNAVAEFSEKLNRTYRGVKREGLDFEVQYCKWKQLPIQFDSFGGKEAATQRHKELMQKFVSPNATAAATTTTAAPAVPAAASVSADGAATDTAAASSSAAVEKEQKEGKEEDEDEATSQKEVQSADDDAVKNEDALETQEGEEAAVAVADNEGEGATEVRNRKRKLSDAEIGGGGKYDGKGTSTKEEVKPVITTTTRPSGQSSASSSSSAVLPVLMSVPQSQTFSRPFRIPAVTWTMLDSK